MAVLPSILQPSIVNERINRLKVKNDTFQRAFGFQSGGANVRRTPSRRGSYDIFDSTRKIANAVLPGVEAATVARFPIGNVPFIIPRSAEKLPIPMEEVIQLRPVGGPVDQLDSSGESYILDQETNQKQTVTNLREFQCVALLRGSYSWSASGNSSFAHAFSGGTITINYQPTGTTYWKNQLNMIAAGDIIGTSWSNSAAPIVRDLLAINQAFIQLCGLGLKDIWINSTLWGNIITNTEVQNLGGSVSNPIKSMVRSEDQHEFTAVLEAVPWVTFHITDVVLDVNGTTTRLLEDTGASFVCGMGDAAVSTYYECPEPVVNPVTNQMTTEYGEYYYHKLIDDPVSYEFHSRFNGLPTLKIPKAKAYGTVVF